MRDSRPFLVLGSSDAAQSVTKRVTCDIAFMSASTSPVRAIRSSLSARPQPSVPSPQQSYIPLAKHILKQRLVRHVYFYSALVCWIQGYIWTVWLLGGVEQLRSSTFVAPFYPLTLLLACATWLVAALPAIVIRKAYLTTTPTPAASPSALVKSALSKSSTTRSTVTYLLSSILILLLHVVFDGDAKLRLFVKSKSVHFSPLMRILIQFIENTHCTSTHA